MAITNGYVTLPELKARLYHANPNLQQDPLDDAGLERVIEAVSRWIDADRGRRFYAATETRYYTAYQSTHLNVDDLLSVTSIKTDPDGNGTYTYTWATTDYQLAPYNETPYTSIETSPVGYYRFSVNNEFRTRVQVIGSFGYCTLANCPPAIKEACILACLRVWSRKDLIFGMAGSAELGTLQAVTPLTRDGELRALLSTVKKRAII
jgi:hypothetical protein